MVVPMTLPSPEISDGNGYPKFEYLTDLPDKKLGTETDLYPRVHK
jgi:hypothetical protein